VEKAVGQAMGRYLRNDSELPIRDLELLLVELGASLFEAQPEKNIEPEPTGDSNAR
jgi:hypothetical protein